MASRNHEPGQQRAPTLVVHSCSTIIVSKNMANQSSALEDVLQRGFRYALSLVHNKDVAQDLVQEACLRINQRGGPWHIAYFITTIRNCYIDQYRRQQKIAFYPIDDVSHIVAAKTVWPSPDPELENALDKLRVEEREILFLSVLEEYSAREIAELTGRPRGTILSMLHRAKKKLRGWITRDESKQHEPFV